MKTKSGSQGGNKGTNTALQITGGGQHGTTNDGTKRTIEETAQTAWTG